MAGLFDDLSWLTQGEAAKRRKAVTEALTRGGVGPAAGVAVREGASATGGALAAVGETASAPIRAAGQELAGFYRALATGETAPSEVSPTQFGGRPGSAVATPVRAITGRTGAGVAASPVAPFTPDVRILETPKYVAADGTPTTDWTKTAAYAEGVKRAEKDITEAALLDIGEAARRTSGASGERERKAAIARARLRLDPTGGAAARRAEVATGLTAQQLAQAARLNQLQAQYLAETDPVKQASLAAQLQAMSGKGEEFKGVELSGGERVVTEGGISLPVKQPGQLALVGSRGTVRQVPIGQPQAQQPAIGVRVSQKDGTYPLADGRKATVKSGVITEIK